MRNVEEKIVLTPAEEAFIARFTAAHCRPHAEVMCTRVARFMETRGEAIFGRASGDWALAAGPASRVPESVRAPDEEVKFVFASEEGADGAAVWRAELVVPPKATVETMLRVRVLKENGDPAAGVFTVAGCALPLAEGEAEIPFGLFLAGLKNTHVSLKSETTGETEGRLLFL